MIGTSKSGAGVVGTSTSQYGVKATSSSGTAIFAQTTSGPSAISATASGGTAVVAKTTSGTTISATSSSGTAIVANTTSASDTVSAISATAANGPAIVGRTTASAVGVSGVIGVGGSHVGDNGVGGYGDIGVHGLSETDTIGVFGDTLDETGTGIYGSAQTGYGVIGYAPNGVGVYGSSPNNYGGYFDSEAGYGVFSNTTGGVAIVGRNSSGNASDIQGSNIGLLGRSPTSGYPLVLTDATPNTLFQVDGYGNVLYTGSLTHVGSLSSGGKARSFSPSATQPTIEDTGTAQLVNGVAAVRLDPTFAASIDPTTAYRVFVTPAGDTRGLFVASRSVAGFIVRESQAGRSTVAFDYRIVASVLGQTGQRMTRINPATDTLLKRAPLPVMPATATVPRPRQIPGAPPAAR